MSTGLISTVAGVASTSGGYNGDNMQATAAKLNYPMDVVIDSAGNLYIADRNNYRIRKVDASTGVITTVVGNGTYSSTGDGAAATSATIKGPCFSRFDSVGNYYITEGGAYFAESGSRIRMVVIVSTDIPTPAPSTQPTYYPSLSPHSISMISTIAGTGTASYSGDGSLATSAELGNVFGIDLDSSGNVYVSDWNNYRVRKITVSTGIITTYAGTGASSYSGDGGAASSAALNNPVGLCIDTSGKHQSTTYKHSSCVNILTNPALGNVYIADEGNHRIRKVTATTGKISTVAGTGASGYNGDNGQATSATISYPLGVAVDYNGKKIPKH